MSDEEKKDLGEKAQDAVDQAKETAKDFAEDAKDAASDFKEDVKETFSADNPDSGKTIAIIAHITIIGWIIALIMNSSNKTELASFYIRQTLGIFLLGIILSFIPFVNLFGWVLVLILWVMSLVGALGENKKPVFLIGKFCQDLFKSL